MWSAGLRWFLFLSMEEPVTRIVCLHRPKFCILAGKQSGASHSYTVMNTKDLLVCDITLFASFCC